jgi:hypothetical protein
MRRTSLVAIPVFPRASASASSSEALRAVSAKDKCRRLGGYRKGAPRGL